MKTLFSAITTFFLPLAVKAQDLGAGSLESARDKAGYHAGVEIQNVVGTVVSAALGLLGVIFLVLTVYGGYIWMIARGDEAKVEKAKNTIINSSIGLVIVLGAYAVTYFIVNAITQSTISK